MESEFLPGDLTLAEPLTTSTPENKVVVGQQFLRFHLLPDTTALLPVYQMTEVLTISLNQIVPIPHMPAWIVGVYNWRGEILWIVDLGHLIGLASIHQQTLRRLTYTTIVIHATQQGVGRQRLGNRLTGRKMLGLVVTQVEDMEWCDTNLIQAPLPASVSPELAPFLRGYWMKSNGEMLHILDGESIFAEMPSPKN